MGVDLEMPKDRHGKWVMSVGTVVETNREGVVVSLVELLPGRRLKLFGETLAEAHMRGTRVRVYFRMITIQNITEAAYQSRVKATAAANKGEDLADG